MYKRTPLPRALKGYPFAALALVVFSPFIALEIEFLHPTNSWWPGVLCALAGCVLLAYHGYCYRKDTPPEIRAEYSKGKLFAPLPDSLAIEPLEIALDDENSAALVLYREHLRYSPAAITQVSWKRAPGHAALLRKSRRNKTLHEPSQSLAWNDVKEWHVKDDRDSGGHYRVDLKDGSHICVRRPENRILETTLLDYVRGPGKTPVRIWCDVE